MIRAVIDTNILVRALLKPEGSVGPVIDALRTGGTYVCTPPPRVIVTGDEDLEVLHPFEGIPLMRPAQFLALLASSER